MYVRLYPLNRITMHMHMLGLTTVLYH